MDDSLDVIGIVREYLMSHQFDGLYSPGDELYSPVGGCACLTGDLSPGSCMSETCRPGYRYTPKEGDDLYGEYDWLITATRKE